MGMSVLSTSLIIFSLPYHKKKSKNFEAKHKDIILPFNPMASIGIASSIQRACGCSSHHNLAKKRSPSRSVGTRLATNVVTPNIEGLEKQVKSPFPITGDSNLRSDGIHEQTGGLDVPLHPRFSDERWKNGTWDLNMFVKQGRMDWDAVIVAEARRRKFLETYPEASTNEEPVHFRSSIIPLWAWIFHSHLPEAELLNGRAAMLGFFAAYVVDGLTGLNVVGQTGNFICKFGLLVTIIGVLVFRKKEDLENVRKLVDEATFYDKQWQASWQKSEDK